jgi:uncharacterized protein YbjT (DUF2867 family)
MNILLTGVSGYVGAALAPRLRGGGHRVRGFARTPARVGVELDDLAQGDVLTGAGLEEAMQGIEVAYYLIHSMEGTGGRERFAGEERQGAERFAAAASAAGVRRVVYLGGLVPPDGELSPHLRSRLAVEDTLLEAAPESIAFRASIVIAARSRSFRFLVRLIERLPVMALPAWRVHRTQPIDGRDVMEFLIRAASVPADLAGSWDIAGPDSMTYAELIERLEESLMVDRPTLRLPFNLTAAAAPVAAAVAGEDIGLIGPLMGSLEHDLLPRPGRDAAEPFGVRLHRFDRAVECALREWEAVEELAAR